MMTDNDRSQFGEGPRDGFRRDSGNLINMWDVEDMEISEEGLRLSGNTPLRLSDRCG